MGAVLQPRPMTTSYVATGPEDLIALAPTVLRFDPDDSVVVLTFGRPGNAFHARVELPRRPREQDEVAEVILKAMKSNHLRDCAVLVYSRDHAAAAAQGRKLNRKLRRAGIRVVDVLTVDGDRYFRVLRGDDKGTVFDINAHPFTAQRVLDGVVVHKSREELAATLAPDHGAFDARDALIASIEEWHTSKRDRVAEAQWVRSVIREATTVGEVSGSDLPRLLADLLDFELTDVAWSAIDKSNADAHVALWRDLVRRVPDAYVDGPACLLAFAAWLAGDGALAWCGLDRCGPDPIPMADMLKELLYAAVPPRLWPGLSAEQLTALRGPAA